MSYLYWFTTFSVILSKAKPKVFRFKSIPPNQKVHVLILINVKLLDGHIVKDLL